jgi:hypothetical protein
LNADNANLSSTSSLVGRTRRNVRSQAANNTPGDANQY